MWTTLTVEELVCPSPDPLPRGEGVANVRFQ
jgi:hypothetical protein